MGQLPIAFRLNPTAGQALYLQLAEQIQHAIATGLLRNGDLMPGIRTLAEELVLSHNTVAKAYTYLEEAGWLELRHGSGAYVAASDRVALRAARLRKAQGRVGDVVDTLRADGLSTEEIRRVFEATLLADPKSARHR